MESTLEKKYPRRDKKDIGVIRIRKQDFQNRK